MEDQQVHSESASESQEASSSGNEESAWKFCIPELDQIISRLTESGKPMFEIQQLPRIPQTNSKTQSIAHQKILGYNRKEKSLEELSRKFIEQFEGKADDLIRLDRATTALGVERRRMYDIINILESLNVVSKIGKNNYKWRGLKEAVRTIRNYNEQQKQAQPEGKKKEKSLEFLAAGFLNLFINRRPAISLEEASRILLTSVNPDTYRTKIRRLYDIVNVFKSLGFVQKVSLPNRKPGFEWVGTSKLEKIIAEKNSQYRRQSSPPKIEDRSDHDTKQTLNFECSPPCLFGVEPKEKDEHPTFSIVPLIPKSSEIEKNFKQYLSNTKNEEVQIKVTSSFDKGQKNIDESTSDRPLRLDIFAGLRGAGHRSSAFSMFQPDEDELASKSKTP